MCENIFRANQALKVGQVFRRSIHNFPFYHAVTRASTLSDTSRILKDLTHVLSKCESPRELNYVFRRLSNTRPLGFSSAKTSPLNREIRVLLVSHAFRGRSGFKRLCE